MRLRLRYNAPVVLTFSLLATAVTLWGWVTGDAPHYFTAPGEMSFLYLPDYFRLVSHVLGHEGWGHLAGNVMLILLLGPLLEEKYGSWPLLEMIAITAAVTGVVNVLLSDHGLLGASGVAFMMIVLSSLASLRGGEVPLTFVLVVVLFIGAELLAGFRDDAVSQLAHIVGGACGAAFGFLHRK